MKKFLVALAVFISLLLIVPSALGQDLPANTEVDIEVEINYSIYGDVFGIEGSSIWNSTQFDYIGFTTGNPFLQGNFTIFVNDTRAPLGEFTYAGAGATPLPVIIDDSTLYTLHLRTKEVSTLYSIEHSFQFNENINTVRIKTGRIVDNTSTELPNSFTHSISVYPNPARDMTTLRFDTFVNGRVDVEVYDTTGRLVYRKNTNVTQGTNEISLRSNDMATGLNLIRVVGNGYQLKTTFVHN